jgi:uncharacterized phiE125 gp8 family phage protein
VTCATEVLPPAYRRTEAPTVEPLTLAEAKEHVRLDTLDGADLDAQVADLLADARSRIEGYTERALLEQTWEARLDDFWGAADLLLPRPNLLTVTEIAYLATAAADPDDEDDWTVVSPTVYEVDVVSVPGRVRLRPAQSWPTAYARAGAVRVTWTAGYGDEEQDVPGDVRRACRLLLGHYDRNREAVITGTIATELPEGVKALLDLERIPWPE